MVDNGEWYRVESGRGCREKQIGYGGMRRVDRSTYQPVEGP